MLRLITIGEVEADAASTGVGVAMAGGGPINVVAEDTSDAGSYDETCVLDGSIDRVVWVLGLASFTAEAQQVSLDEPWAYLRVRQAAGAGTAGTKLTLKALVLE